MKNLNISNITAALKSINPTVLAAFIGAFFALSTMFALVLGMLNVVNSVPLIGNVLDLVAVYYLYKDRERVVPFVMRSARSAYELATSDETGETELLLEELSE